MTKKVIFTNVKEEEMKKINNTILVAGLLLFVSGLKAQSIQEGKNDLDAGRVKNAISNFDKMIAVNPNDIEAIYWLGQAYLDNDEIAGSRIKKTKELYEKGLQTSANAPLLLAGLGHIELLENKTNDARQHFETALSMTRTKKGEDQNIVLAVARANVDAKSGDFNYAIDKLKAGIDNKGDKNPELFLQLGNAYRKAKPGEGGGDAFENYKKALAINPAYSLANLRLAKLFESQKNWDLVLQYLNDAVEKEPRFSEGYYELFYYYFFRAKFPEAEEQLKKYIDSKLPVTDIQDQYLYAQLCWAKKDFDCAIAKAESVVTAMGDLTKPKVYRLLADAYYQKGDYNNAKKYSDVFFAKKNPDDVILPDFENRALIMAKLGSDPESVYETYLSGAALDTTVAAKIDYLKKGSAYFKDNKQRDKEAKIIEKIIALKPAPSINDYFDLTIAYYFSGNYDDARATAIFMTQKYPDEVYGYDWAYNSAVAIVTDTTRKVSQDTLGFPAASKLYEFAIRDTAKFKKQYVNAVKFLAAYYINEAKDKEKSLEFFRKWLEADAANATTIQGYIDQIEKMPSSPSPKGAGTKAPSSSNGKIP